MISLCSLSLSFVTFSKHVSLLAACSSRLMVNLPSYLCWMIETKNFFATLSRHHMQCAMFEAGNSHWSFAGPPRCEAPGWVTPHSNGSSAPSAGKVKSCTSVSSKHQVLNKTTWHMRLETPPRRTRTLSLKASNNKQIMQGHFSLGVMTALQPNRCP